MIVKGAIPTALLLFIITAQARAFPVLMGHPQRVSDTTPLITLVANDETATEAGSTTAFFTVSRTGSTASALTVNYTVGGTASSSDYQPLSGSVVIPANQTSATITLTPIDDDEIEGDETVVVTLSASASYAIGTPASATVIIADNDAPVVTITAGANAAEPATPGQFTVSRGGSTALALTVNYTVAGTASNGTDYQTLPMSVAIAAGQSSATITVTPIDDSVPEGNETVILTLAAGTGYSVGNPGNATVTIADNDGTAITASATSIGAGGSVTVTWNGIVSPAARDWVALASVGSGNTSFIDWVYVSCTKNPGSATANGSCPLALSPTMTLGNYELRLFSNDGFTRLATTVFTVVPRVTIAATDSAASEAGLDRGVFTVSRTGATAAAALTVKYTIDGTATNGTDYETLPTTITIPANQASVTITVIPKDDSAIEGTETVILTIDPDAAYTVGSPNSATVTIADDDAPLVTVVATDNTAAEAGLDPGVFRVSRTESTGTDLTVNYAMSGSAGNGVDYESLPLQVVIPTGSSFATVTVTPKDDGAAEGNETVIMTLTAGVGYTVGTPSSATVTILDNDGTNISVVPSSRAAGGTVTASWSGIVSPAARDWVALASVGSGNTSFIDWVYVSCTKNPGSGSVNGNCPLTLSATLTPGNYELRLFSNDGFTRLATSNGLTVTAPLPVVTIVATDNAAAEAGLDRGVFTVTRSIVTASPLAVKYTIDGTTTNGTDYETLPTTITIPANQTSVMITVIPKDDFAIEGAETIVLTLDPDAAYTVGSPNSATVTIADDDAPIVTVVATDNTAAEAGLDPGVFRVSRTGSTATDLTVNYAMSGSAGNGVDYESLPLQVVIPTGSSSTTVTVTPKDDGAAEGNETVIMTLTVGAGYTVGNPNSATVTILDNDGTNISVTPPSMGPGGTVTVTWSGIISAAARDWVALALVGAGNTSFIDWVYVSCSKGSGAARQNGFCSFPLATTLAPGNYEFRLFSNDGFTRLATSNGLTVTPPLPVVTIVATDNTATEAGVTTALFTVSRTGLTTGPLTVNYAVGGTALNGDYQTLNGNVTIPSNLASATITLTPIDDGAIDGDRTLNVTLSTDASYTVGSPSCGTAVIIDNDGVSGLTITATPNSGSCGGGVTASWSTITNPTARDWIGLYRPATANTTFLAWIYVSCSQAAAGARGLGACQFVLPPSTTPGTYELRLLANDGFSGLATSNPFTVN